MFNYTRFKEVVMRRFVPVQWLIFLCELDLYHLSGLFCTRVKLRSPPDLYQIWAEVLDGKANQLVL